MTLQKRTCLLMALLLQLAALEHRNVSPLPIAWPDISGVASMLARYVEGLCVYTGSHERTQPKAVFWTPATIMGQIKLAWAGAVQHVCLVEVASQAQGVTDAADMRRFRVAESDVAMRRSC